MESARFSDGKPNGAGDRLRLHELERRDWHLWSLAVLIIIALASCILAIAFQQLGNTALLGAHLNTYLIALLVLVVLFCGYTIQTVAEIKVLRRRLSTSETEKDAILRMAAGFAQKVPSRRGHHWYQVMGTRGCLEWKRSEEDRPKMWLAESQMATPELAIEWFARTFAWSSILLEAIPERD